jgi:hypothetical protein
MARKSLGFVPLVWECPSCETQNPGPIKSCTSCGAPQPPDVEFQLVDEDKFNFIKDEALLREIKSGPNIHCPYCGTRNPATNKLCQQCGGDLSMGGKTREAGQRVKTVSEAQAEVQPRPSPVGGVKLPGNRKRLFLIFGILGIIATIICVVLIVTLTKTDDITGTVTGLQWERSIVIEAYTTVNESDWLDEVPMDGEIISCSQAYRYSSDTPVANATEVCGEIYYEDTGSGAAEAVQDCTYEVYDDYCEYTIMDWVAIETAVASGTDPDPYWPEVILSMDEREGASQESYLITFSGDGETYQYSTTDSQLFEQAEPGSRWTLSVNQLGGVQSIEPVN